MPKTYYYCELCDYMCDTHYFHVTHVSSKDHLNKCKKYKDNIIQDEQTLNVFRKLLLDVSESADETKIEYNNDELCETVIMCLSNYKLPLEQIQQIKLKNKQFETSIQSDNNHTTDNIQ